MPYVSKSFRAGWTATWPFRLVLLFVAVLVLPYFAAAQQGTILGTVTDQSGAAVLNAEVNVLQLSTGTLRTFTTNDVGQYVVPDLPVGKYDVKCSASGFKLEEQKGVVVNLNDRIRVDFQLKVGAKTETISVEAEALKVQSDSSEQSTLVESKQITELATNGRVIYSYVVLTTGASSLMSDSQLPVPVGGNSNFSINGNRPTHNLYLLDGGENADRGGSSSNSSVMPSMDAIAETQVLTSNYSADYGLSSGGTISSAVKSGTQTFHASAWEFFRNNALDARNFFNPAPATVAELRYNVFGFNVGGPVTFGKLYNPDKKKTFFFYNMEWRKIIQGGSPINTTVPNPLTYGGDFSSVAPTAAKLHAPYQCSVSAAIQAQFAAAGQALSGCTAGAPDPTKLVPFTGNKIPTALLNSYAQSLLTAGGKYGGIFPAPTNGNQFTLPVSSPTNVREEIIRIDHNFSDKFSIYGHFVAEQIAQNFATSMWSGDNVPSIGNTFGNPSYAGVVHTTYAISPTLINEISFNYNGNRIAITPSGLYTSPGSFNRFFTGPNVDDRIPSIQLSGSTGTNYTVNWMPWNNKADDYQLRDDVSWTKGRHQLKMGGSWMLYKKNQDWFANTQGNYQFSGQYTGNDFADYLLGYAQNYTENAIKSVGHWNNVSWGLYVQDNWRVSNHLTLNLGLRWDGIPHTYEANNQMNNFYPNLYNTSAPALLNSDGNTINPASPGLGPSSNPILAGQLFYVNGIATCGFNGIPSGCVNGAWLNFEPRLGFAYDVTGQGKTIIRGGYGIMNERVQGNDVYNNAGTVPLSASINFNNVVLANPGTALAGANSVGIPVNNVTGLDRNNYKAPRSTQFSLGIQQSIGKSVLSVAYVGAQNRHQNYYTEANLLDESLLPAYVSGTCSAISAACPVVNAKPVAYNSQVPYVGYHDLRISRNEANSDYNSVQASMRGTTFSNDLTYQFGYTFSHTNDSFNSGSSGGDLYNVSDPYLGWKYDFGPSMYDHRNIFFANFVYDIPLMKHSDNKLAKTLIGGWEISGIINVMSGAPLNIGINNSVVQNGVTINSVAGIVPQTANRPNQTGSGSNPHTVNDWFDTSIYSAPACLTGPDCWGNTRRNSVWGPGRDNWNISFFKNFVFSEARGSNLQFRAEFFNIWNHTQFQGDTQNNGISTNLGASNFGQVTQAYDPRIIQLALKLYF
jgi:Carboxypeptidase regulatory-like domain/TonB-dependent Receptor Plug Domain